MPQFRFVQYRSKVKIGEGDGDASNGYQYSPSSCFWPGDAYYFSPKRASLTSPLPEFHFTTRFSYKKFQNSLTPFHGSDSPSSSSSSSSSLLSFTVRSPEVIEFEKRMKRLHLSPSPVQSVAEYQTIQEMFEEFDTLTESEEENGADESRPQVPESRVVRKNASQLSSSSSSRTAGGLLSSQDSRVDEEQAPIASVAGDTVKQVKPHVPRKLFVDCPSSSLSPSSSSSAPSVTSRKTSPVESRTRKTPDKTRSKKISVVRKLLLTSSSSSPESVSAILEKLDLEEPVAKKRREEEGDDGEKSRTRTSSSDVGSEKSSERDARSRRRMTCDQLTQTEFQDVSSSSQTISYSTVGTQTSASSDSVEGDGDGPTDAPGI